MPARRCVAIAATLLAVLGACETDPSGPGAPQLVHLQIRPELQSAVAPTLLNLDQFHVTVRGASGDLLVDTTIGYDADTTTTLGWVLGLDAPSEPLAVRAEVMSLGRLMFQAESTFVVDVAAVGTSEIHTVSLAYAGPGLDVAQLEIQPADSVLTWDDTLRYRATATDTAGAEVTDFVIVWESSDPTVAPIDDEALLTAPTSGRDTVRVFARIPTGVTGSTPVRFLPPPASLIALRGDEDTAAVGQLIPLEVQALGSDGLGVEGVAISFQAPSGATVTDAVVITDTFGTAGTTGTLGTTAGAYPFEANVAGLAPTALRAVAVAGPGAALAFTVQPTTTTTASVISPAVDVTIHDAFGNIATGTSATIALSFSGSPSGADLLGTTSIAAVEGTASFADLRIEQPGFGYRLAADADGLTAAVSDPFDVTQNVEAVTVTPDAVTLDALGNTTQLTATATDGVGNPIPNQPFVWASLAPTIATVNANGLVTAAANGTAGIVASVNGTADTAQVTVAQAIDHVTVTPPT
ncbi:MAG: Ig-like domain-containing protein, partial [Gemmatimonadetes bacterium]|nr:Ig-like domain-containing protein [Gemmatimonadota bacterium]